MPPQATLDDDDLDPSKMENEELGELSSEADETLESDNSGVGRRRRRSVAVPTPRFAPRSRLRSLSSHRAADRQLQVQSNRPLSVEGDLPASNDAGQRPFAYRLGLEPKKLAVMQASFFSKPDMLQEHHEPRKGSNKQALEFKEVPRLSSPHMQNLPFEQPGSQPLDVDPGYRALRQWQMVPLSDSCASLRQDGSPADAGLLLGRSFGICWGSEGQLVHNGRVGQLASQKK